MTQQPYGTDPGDYRRDPNRHDDMDRGAGWGIAIVVALVLILGVYLVARAWRNDRNNLAENTNGPSISSPSDTTPNRFPPVSPAMEDAVPAASVQQPATLPSAQPVASGGVTLDNLLQQPATYYGQNVNITGTVRKVLNNHAFTLSSDAEGGQELLVVNNQQNMLTPVQGQRIRVSGTFNSYEQSRISETLGTNFNEQTLAPYADRPAIVAQRIERMGDMAQ